MTIDALGPFPPALRQGRRVIAVELEGWARRRPQSPLSAEQMADDVAGLLGQLGIERADVCGFSLGGMTALRLAIRHPALVRKLPERGRLLRHVFLDRALADPDARPAQLPLNTLGAPQAVVAVVPPHLPDERLVGRCRRR
jgi:pimeloyl-ACP methyl ester carboxylesterase